jgi:hypothetical protein
VVVGSVFEVKVKSQSGNSAVSEVVIEWDMDIAVRSQAKVRCINSVDVVNSAVKSQSGNSAVSEVVIEWDMDIAAVSADKDQSQH